MDTKNELQYCLFFYFKKNIILNTLKLNIIQINKNKTKSLGNFIKTRSMVNYHKKNENHMEYYPSVFASGPIYLFL